MDNKEYLDFDEAVTYLKTTSSTLYKWLQTGKIPGHKLGRQWRFLAEELELHVSGKTPKIEFQKEILKFQQFLIQRAKNNSKEGIMNSANDLSEMLIWDAHERGVREVHISPAKGKHEVSYRKWRENAQPQIQIEAPLLKSLDESWMQQSMNGSSETSRRLNLYRNDEEVLQVRYQKIETISGPHISLTLLQGSKDVLGLEKLGFEKSQRQQLVDWLKRPKGLIVISGPAGSGKTTTVYSAMNELRNSGRIVFTLESPAVLALDGVSQVEFHPHNKTDFETKSMAVQSAGADVLILGLGTVSSALEEAIYQAAREAASSGMLVVLQVTASSNPEALQKISKGTTEAIDDCLIGSCYQELIGDNGAVKAKYLMFEPVKT